MPGDRESSLAAGATEYVTKPVDLDELLSLMAAWVAPASDRRATPVLLPGNAAGESPS